MRFGTMAGAMMLAALPVSVSGRAMAQDTPATAPAPDLAGHYYLSGIMEMGSELLLRPDGSYEWMLAYGALDVYAKGSWRRDGGHLVLTAREIQVGAPDKETDALMRKTFGTMTLDIADGALLPRELEGGRYTRP